MTMPADNTPAIEAERLLPCPFCGADPLVNIIEPHSHGLRIGDWKMPDHEGSCVIECGCGAGLIDDTQAKVTARWNRRTPPAQAPKAVALWQFRWTNPADNPNVSPDELAWQEVKVRNVHTDTIDGRIRELLSYRYAGKPTYEVRALYAARSSAPGSAVEVETKESGDADQA